MAHRPLVSFNFFDIQLMVIGAVVAVGLRLLDFALAPLLLGFIQGGMMEVNLRRALIIDNNFWSFLLEQPLTLAILLLAAAALVVPMRGPRLMAFIRARTQATGESL